MWRVLLALRELRNEVGDRSVVLRRVVRERLHRGRKLERLVETPGLRLAQQAFCHAQRRAGIDRDARGHPGR